MITIKDINKAVADKITIALSATEYKEIEFASKDIIEEITRPSLYFGIGAENKVGLATNRLKERCLEVNIFYFAKSRNNKLDLLTMQSYLEDILLTDLVVNEYFFFTIDNVNFDIKTKEGYLLITFVLESLEEIKLIDNAEPIENLHLKIKDEG